MNPRNMPLGLSLLAAGFPMTSSTRRWSPDSAHVPMTFPEPVEITDPVLTDADRDALAKAEAKRLRKQARKS